MSEFRTAARQTASAIMANILPNLSRSILGDRGDRVTIMSRSSNDLSQSVSGVRDTVEEINYNLGDVNETMKKTLVAMKGAVVAIDKQNVSITKGFGVVAGAITALLAAAGLSYLASDSKEASVEPKTGVAPAIEGPDALKPLASEKRPLEDLTTPVSAKTDSFQTPSMQPAAAQESTRVSTEAVTPQPAKESGFIIPGAATVTPSSSVAPMMTTPKSTTTSAANDNRSMVEIRNSQESQLPKNLELSADSITFSAGVITMKDRSRENRVSREIQALRDKSKVEDVGASVDTEEQLTGVVEPSMGLTPSYGSGAGSAGGVGSVPDSLKTGENGKLRDDQLAPIGIGDLKAHPKAAEAFKAMRAAAAAEGVDLGVTGAYRTYERQVQLKAEKGGMAATPGRSNHGWGLAFDMSFGSNMNSAGFQWMAKNAARFGIQGPLQSPFEPWHWEYRGGEDAKAVEAAKQQAGATPGMGEGRSPMVGSDTSAGSMMPGQTGAPMMLPPSAGGDSGASMMAPSIGTGMTLNRQSVAPTLNSARQPTAMAVGNPNPTSNPVKDSTSNNPRIADPAVVGPISPDFNRFAKVFAGWGSTLLSAAGR